MKTYTFGCYASYRSIFDGEDPERGAVATTHRWYGEDSDVIVTIEFVMCERGGEMEVEKFSVACDDEGLRAHVAAQENDIHDHFLNTIYAVPTLSEWLGEYDDEVSEGNTRISRAEAKRRYYARYGR